MVFLLLTQSLEIRRKVYSSHTFLTPVLLCVMFMYTEPTGLSGFSSDDNRRSVGPYVVSKYKSKILVFTQILLPGMKKYLNQSPTIVRSTDNHGTYMTIHIDHIRFRTVTSFHTTDIISNMKQSSICAQCQFSTN